MCGGMFYSEGKERFKNQSGLIRFIKRTKINRKIYLMKSRRSFIKHAALGSAVLSAGGTLSVLGTTGCAGQSQENRGSNSGRQKESLNFQGWSISFDEGTSALSMVNGPVSLQGQLEFVSGDKKWAVANSRDGVPDRYALVDTQDNVQGYFVFIGDKNKCRSIFIIVLHRLTRDCFHLRGK